MKPLTAWTPGFSRSKQFEPPQGETPNQTRFMESLDAIFGADWDHEPRFCPTLTRNLTLTLRSSIKSRSKSKSKSKKSSAESAGGVFLTTRFMESPLSIFRMHWDHDPRFCLTLTRNLTLTLRSSIKNRIKSKSKKS